MTAVSRSRLSRSVGFQGVGVHSGAGVSLVVGPGEGGVVLRRVDTGGTVRASWRNVTATALQTVIAEGGTSVATVEHLMSALSALGVWDAAAEIDGPEVPIMDGSAAPFLAGLAEAVAPAGEVAALRVTRPVAVRRGGSFAALLPHEGRRFDVGIDFPDAAIGIQRVALDLDADTFARDVAPARTFGRLADVARMRSRGLGLGASLENAVAVDGSRIANPEGLRFPDEFARHKLIDAVGDLALAGLPIIGLYRAHRGGHRLNFELLEALFSRPDAYVATAA